MSLVVDIRTKSRNGLPLKTLRKTMVRYGKALVEEVAFKKFTRSGRAVYEVTLHDSVNLEVEKLGQ